MPTWVWIAGGAALAVGAGVGAYFLLSGDSGDQPNIPYDAPDGVVVALH